MLSSRIFVVFVVSWLGLSNAWAETVYVHARQANILSGPSVKAPVVTLVKRGQALVVDAKQGRWLQVSVNNRQGWVSRLLVKNKPVMDRVSVLQDADEQLQSNARRRASSATESAATRGLRSDDRLRLSDESVVDFDSLERMEGLSVSEDDAVTFLEQGQ